MRNHMMKWTGLLITAILMLALGTGLADGPLSTFYAAGEKLLTETENVTLKGEAEFFLDGTSFKKAVGMYIQDGPEAFQQIDLTGTDTYGTEQVTGYAVLDLAGEALSSEIYHGIDHRFQRSFATSNTILPERRNILQVLKLGRVAAATLEQSPAAEVQADGTSFTLKMGETAEIPEVVQSALNLLWQEGIARYYLSAYTLMYAEPYAQIEDYETPTQGIVMTTREIRLKVLNAEAALDAEGRVSSLKGDAAFLLQGGESGEHELKISFSMNAEAYGESMVRGNEAVSGRMAYAYDAAGNAIPKTADFRDCMTQRAIANEEDAISYAQEIWGMDYLAAGDLSGLTWIVRPVENGHLSVWGYDPEDLPSHYYMVETDETGWIYGLRNTFSEVDQAVEYMTDGMDTATWDTYRLSLIYMSLNFAEALNPQDAERIGAIRYDNIFGGGVHGMHNPGYGGASIHGDSMFLTFFGDPDPEKEIRTKIVFQIEPVFRVVLFNQLNNALEGGNG